MSDLISRSALDSFFYSETSGTEEVIEDAVMKYPDMEMEYPDDCRALCKDIIEMCRNVIRTEPTAYDVEKVTGEIEDVLWNCYIDNGQGFKTYVNRACEILKRGGIE